MATAAQRGNGTRVGIRAGGEAALDVLLADAALDRGTASRFLQPTAAAQTVAALARRPGRLARRAGGLGAELGRIATGSSTIAPARGDRRFVDRGWDDNWLLHRLMQTYLAAGVAADALITDAELGWQAERQVRFAVRNVLDALAPTNFPWSNPTVLRETVDTGGANLVRGARRFVHDVSRPPRLPVTVDTSQFEVGENLAATPGSVICRTDVFELIHYRPQTRQVWETPLLFVPPTINKYYVLDLAPGRSMIEYLLAQGQQVFMISWRNPDVGQAHFDLDTYAGAVGQAVSVAAEVAGQPSVHIAAACSGGLISACLLSHIAAQSRLGEVASLTLLVSALDNPQAGTTSALSTPEVAAAAVAESARKGYLDGRALAGVFAWLRPNDLIWRYVINNYLLGKDPPAFDVLYWNQDTVRLAAGLHRDFIHLALNNSLTHPGALTVLDTPVDLGQVELDSYVVAGLSDHIVPWENAYRGGRLLGRAPRFVLSTSGHIQALVNPPAPDSRASYRIADAATTEPEEWLTSAAMHQGSWWPNYAGWLAERSGERRAAPKALGSARHAAGGRAPGSYVHAS